MLLLVISAQNKLIFLVGIASVSRQYCAGAKNAHYKASISVAIGLGFCGVIRQ